MNLLRMQHMTFDASGKAPGRLATEIAGILVGKGTPQWAPNALPDVTVTVTNVAGLAIPARRMRTKLYRRHSMHPGGFRTVSLGRMMETHPEEVLRLAVYGMLPHNRLRDRAMRRLRIFKGATNENEKR